MIPISPNPDGIRDYMEMRLDKDPEPDAMNDELRGDIPIVILERTSDMCVGVSGISTLSVIFIY